MHSVEKKNDKEETAMIYTSSNLKKGINYTHLLHKLQRRTFLPRNEALCNILFGMLLEVIRQLVLPVQAYRGEREG